MSKHEVIREIRRHNPSAPEFFLAMFPAQHLTDYLCRLTACSQSTSSWVRASTCPAITFRLP